MKLFLKILEIVIIVLLLTYFILLTIDTLLALKVGITPVVLSLIRQILVDKDFKGE